MLAPPKTLTSAAEVTANMRRTRSYFNSLHAPPAPPEPPSPPPNPTAGLIAEVVQAVSTKTSLQVPTILVGLSSAEAIEARRVAMAVCVVHLHMREDVVARNFNVLQEAVARAGNQGRAIYMRAAVPKNAPIYGVVGVLVEHWERTPMPVFGKIGIIKRAVCRTFIVSMEDLESGRRGGPIVVARHAAIALCRRLTEVSIIEIGRRFGRDHTTTLYAINKMKPFIGLAARELPEGATIDQWVVAVCEVLATQKELEKSTETRK